MKRLYLSAIIAAIGFTLLGIAARAQLPPAAPPPVPSPSAPASAIEGTITAVRAGSATLQTPDGQSLTLVLRRRYLFVDPSPDALSTGMRVFALGNAQSDGSIAVNEIDALAPLNLMMVTPAPARTSSPTAR